MSIEQPPKKAKRDVDDFRPLSSDEMFEVVRLNGVEELARPTTSLAWSGLAAGLAISFSVVAEAAIVARLPLDTGWSDLVADIGYTIGFILVVLGRFQLFTENTITPVVPICHEPTRENFLALVRNWSVVFAANMVGVTVFAAFVIFTPAVVPEIRDAILHLGRHTVEGDFLETMTRGVGAGFLIAALVWMIANSRGGALLAVFVVTYVIALCGFAHVIAGTMEIAALVLAGSVTLGDGVFGFVVPAFIGNVLGGTVLFTFIAYGQVYREIRGGSDSE